MLFSFAQQVRYFKKMLKTKIKASGINNLTDARYFAAREVKWLGFRFGGSSRDSISILAAKAIAEWVDGVEIVGEFDFATAEEIISANELLHFDAVQVGMYTPVSELETITGLTFMKEVVVESATTEAEILAHFEAYEPWCTYFILDFTKAGINWKMLQTGGPLSINFLKKLFYTHKVILSLDFLPHETLQVLELLNPIGLSLAGGEEEKIGLKSFETLDSILDSLEAIP
ncbi:MAG: hypothetical protein GC192_04945 [Bacteroidetes bacterium]|nr:hypothetical protein [Bacteroidota bacterium]